MDAAMQSGLDPAAFFEGLDVARARGDLVALGGTLGPEMLHAAYRAGCFPWPSGDEDDPAHARSVRRWARHARVPVLAGEDELVPWCSPSPRAVLLTDRLTLPRSLRTQLRRCGWTTTVDAAFERVLAACADRDETWITGRMRAAYTALHAEGGAHSVEVWDGTELVGGLYGVMTGAVFSGESMFHRASGASKAAVVDLCARLLEAGVVLLDTQQETPHLAALGQALVDRADYVEAVRRLRDVPVELAVDRRDVARLV